MSPLTVPPDETVSQQSPITTHTPAELSLPQATVHPLERGRVDKNARSGQQTPLQHGTRSFEVDASVVLVGIRGSGKRSLGFIAATALGRRFITEDHFFESQTGLSRQDYLKLHGSEDFHKHDVEISRLMLEQNRTGCVIDCGLGSLTSGLQDYLRNYCTTNPVIHIVRDMRHIRALLKLSDRSVRLLESGDASHRRCSNYEYFNVEDNTADRFKDQEGFDRGSPEYSFKLQESQEDFAYFVKLITDQSSPDSSTVSPFSLDIPVETRMNTHALEVPFSAYVNSVVQLSKLEAGGDVIEIRVDQWHSNSTKTLVRMVAEIRRFLKLPIVLSIAHQMMSLTIDTYLAILKFGLRLGLEFLSLDTILDGQHVTDLLSMRGNTKFIGTVNLIKTSSDKSVWLDGTALHKMHQAIKKGFHLIRLLHAATNRAENDNVKLFLQTVMQQEALETPIIAYNTGSLGRTSQIFNSCFTSVTHETFAAVQTCSSTATRGVLTASQIMQSLFSVFILDPLNFYIIGGNVSKSLSPAMHNAAYAAVGLSHKYSTKNIKSWEDVEMLSKDPNFGGASIVQPWKVRLAKKVAYLSENAKIIGAINTLVPLRASTATGSDMLPNQAAHRNQAGPVVAWYGDNTDWIAMSVCITRGLSPRNVIQQRSTALVVGAGGMARSAVYALIKIGVKNVFIYNRTLQNAEALASYYNGWLSSLSKADDTTNASIDVLQSLDQTWPSAYVLPTIVVSCVTHEHLEGNPDANFTMPEPWLGSESGGVVLELAYMTRETPLISQVKRYRQATGRSWVIVDGISTLFEQALAQFETMTGRVAPKRRMQNAITKAIQETQTFVADGEEFEVV